ncbi:hypothetical protein, partial [Mesorhizobium sp. M1E.F.Ca.ET.041.01.1.1]|uniref:hypothetical protein n=1 Tax=Mesorhizobium sp. M1E.F.Ca.ET.041.01.1.1 TaxID=2496759 RepID=UPI001AECA190
MAPAVLGVILRQRADRLALPGLVRVTRTDVGARSAFRQARQTRAIVFAAGCGILIGVLGIETAGPAHHTEGR